MIDLTPERIREVCGAALLAGGPGRVSPEDMPRRVVVDSRDVRRGDLFIGIPGEHVDGGQFAEEAASAEAWGVLVQPRHGLRVAGMAGRMRVMAVDDPLEALGRLGRAWVDRLWSEGCKVIAITGSTGKTSTKDILLSLLAPTFGHAIHASPRNYNTEIGLPLAALGAQPGTRVLVLEMAMRGPGQIKELCDIAPPEIGVITNVGPVHLESLGTIEAVAEAKAELIRALPPEGICVVPATAEALRPHLRKEIRTLSFASWPNGDGETLAEAGRISQAAADVRAIRAVPARVDGSDGLEATIALGAEQVEFKFNFGQAHNLANALAAIGAAHALGLELDGLVEGARHVTFSEFRGEQIELPGGAVVINDCYNANPISMRAAIDHLAEVAAQRHAARAVAVLGDMAELGPAALEFHREIGEHAARKGVGLLLTVGGLASAYGEGYGNAGEVRAAADADEAAAIAGELIAPGDIVLVKGSRSVGLERVTESFTSDGSGEPA